MILSVLARKIRRFVRGNSRLIDKENNVAAHIPLRLRIHDQPILNFGRGDMSAITLNVGRLSSLCIITFLCPRSQETGHGKKKQCHQHALLRVPTKDSLLLKLFAPIWSLCWSVECKNCSMDGKRNKANEFSSCMVVWSEIQAMCIQGGRIFFKSTDG